MNLMLFIALAVIAYFSVAESRAQTASYPDKPIRRLVGFSPGGGTDGIARIVAHKMSEGLGQSVRVENRPGASGMIAAEAVTKSAPDGYTLMMGSQTTLAVAPSLYLKFSRDPAKDLPVVALAGTSACRSTRARVYYMP